MRIPTLLLGAFCLAVAWAVAANDLPDTPVLHVPFVKAAPTIDGRINPDEWAGAARMTGFMTYGEAVMVPKMLQPVWWLAWDDRTLYFAQTLPLYPKGTIIATEKRSDQGGANAEVSDRLLYGDHIEIQLATVERRSDVLDEHFYKLVVNPYGAMEDTRRRHTVGWAGLEWESDARVACDVTETLWSIELALPLASIGFAEPPRDLTRLYAQLVSAADSELFYTAWVPAAWLSWKVFPELYLSRTAPAIQIAFPTAPEEGPLDVAVAVANRTDAPARVTAEVTVGNVDGKEVFRQAQPAAVDPSQTETLAFRREQLDVFKPDGLQWAGHWLREKGRANRLSVVVRDADGAVLYYNPFRYSLTPADLESAWLKPYSIRRKVTKDPNVRTAYMASCNVLEYEVDVDVLGIDPRIKAAVTAEIVLEQMLRGHRQVVARDAGLRFAEVREPIPETGLVKGLVEVPPLAEGQYVVISRLLDTDGKELYRKEEAFRRYRFAWEKNDLGQSLYPIPPFTRLARRDDRLTLWNRAYTFAGSGLPRSIVSGGVEMLAGEPEFSGTIAGQPVSLGPAGALQWTQDHPGRMIAVGTGKLGPLDVRIRATTEYDGLTLYEVTLAPARAVTVSALNLTIKAPTVAVSDYLVKGPTAEVGDHGALPGEAGEFWSSLRMNGAANIRGRFLPYLYLGDGERALCYVAASDQGWMLDFGKPSSHLERTPDDVRLVLHIANTEYTLDKPRTFVFGLQAGPVKPRPEDERWGYGHDGPQITPDHPGFFVNYGGSALSCMSLGPGTDTLTMRDDLEYEILRDEVLSFKRQFPPDFNRRVIKYIPTNVLGLGMKEFETYAGEWTGNTVVAPHPHPGFTALHTPFGFFNDWEGTRQFADMCQSMVDMRVWAFDQHQRRAGLNGYWWDHSMYWSSGSLPKGTAYVMDDGTVQGVLNVFLFRQMMKRMAVVSYLNAMRLENGQYTPAILPTWSFGSYSWAVEGVWYCKPGKTALDNFPDLDRFRARAGKWSGLPVHWTTHGAEEEFQARSVIGLALLHDMSLTSHAIKPEFRKALTPALEAFDWFDSRAEWVPYWRSADLVGVDGGGQRVVATVYLNRHACEGRKALIVLFNAGDRDATARVTLQGEELVGGAVSAILEAEKQEALSAEQLARLPLRRHDYMLVVVR